MSYSKPILMFPSLSTSGTIGSDVGINPCGGVIGGYINKSLKLISSVSFYIL